MQIRYICQWTRKQDEPILEHIIVTLNIWKSYNFLMMNFKKVSKYMNISTYINLHEHVTSGMKYNIFTFWLLLTLADRLFS